MSEGKMAGLDRLDAEAFRVMEELLATARGAHARIRLLEASRRQEARKAIREAMARFGDSPAVRDFEMRLDSHFLELRAALDALRLWAFEGLAGIAEAHLPGGRELLAELIEDEKERGIQ